ncbi:MAG: hypothetical protein H6773_02995 [Pseudomonadales bacterium]|nr:hypothetical protein [Pseudomonadales bacterium]
MSENHERTKNEPISSESLEFFNQFYEFLLSDPDDATFRISLGTAFQIHENVQKYLGLYRLDTNDLSKEDRLIARIVVFLESIGNHSPFGNNNAASSKKIHIYLDNCSISEIQKRAIIKYVRHKRVLRDIALNQFEDILKPSDLAQFFSLRELEVQHRITQSIFSGDEKQKQEILSVYCLLKDYYSSRKDTIVVEQFENPEFPFEKVDIYEALAIGEDIRIEAVFDLIENPEQQMLKQRSAFDELSEETKNMFEKALIQVAFEPQNMYSYESPILFLLKVMGREMDRSYVIYLEKKFAVKLDILRVAIESFLLTYSIWKVRYTVRQHIEKFPNDIHFNLTRIPEMMHYLDLLIVSSQFLSAYSVEAIHRTDQDGYEGISINDVIWKSDTDLKNEYVGDGVYAGALNSFGGWKDDEYSFSFLIPLATTVPNIASYNFPRYEVSILGDGLDVKEYDNLHASPAGIIQWKDAKFEGYGIKKWQTDILSDFLDCKVGVFRKKNGAQIAVLDTDKDPIEWATLCQTLCIPHAIPLSELSKLEYLMEGELFETASVFTQKMKTADI